ncbi:hypothetical protein HBA54_09890 [Pelagibius litoralis]|uniref:Uncharacterized protein n=1 Tax=Pelagibius litoralis TaxID=374515 RepID=A0A967C370_9PROT|nr:hypothetical protein [Pelagibius litoralis]NIA68903.1 hypothetical protein [Pelagibius litoralis]
MKICVSAALAGLLMMTAPASAYPGRNDHAQVLQAAIDFDGLDPYYHADTLPERTPLRLACKVDLCAGLALTKFGTDVVVLPRDRIDDAQMLIETLDLKGAASRVTLTYPAEGIRADLALERHEDIWRVVRGEVAEQ